MLALVRNLTPLNIVILGFIIAEISPPLRQWVGFFDTWDKRVFEYTAPWTPSMILRGYLVSAFFPIFPWLSFPLFGFALGKVCFNRENGHHAKEVFLLGLVLLTLGIASILAAKFFRLSPIASFYLSNWTVAYTKYPATNTYLLLSLGLICITFSILVKFLDTDCNKKILSNVAIKFLTRYSKFSLSVYVIHHLAHVEPLRLFGYLKSGNESAYWGSLVPFSTALSIGAAFSLLFYLVLVAWDERGQGKYSLEWCLSKLLKDG